MGKLLDETGLGTLISWISARVFKAADGVATNVIGVDSAPTRNSSNLVRSGGVYTSIHENTSNCILLGDIVESNVTLTTS